MTIKKVFMSKMVEFGIKIIRNLSAKFPCENLRTEHAVRFI